MTRDTINWRTVVVVVTVLVAASGVVAFFATWNTGQDAHASDVRVELEAVKTSLSDHRGQADATFRTIDTTLRAQQEMIIEVGRATAGMKVSQDHVAEALRELKAEVKELRP